MRFPCEYVALEFLPGLRIRVAHILRESGLSQNEIAKNLSVKQPVVVSYLKAYKKRIEEEGEDNFHLDSLANEIAELILKGKPTPFIMRTVCTRCKALRVDSFICTKHRELIPELTDIKNCDICSGFITKIPQRDERTTIINALKESFEKLKTIKGFAEWVPEIGSQLAHCNDKTAHPDDIASFPGRIIRVKGEILTVREPEFGNSKTMSSMLLWIRKYQPDTKWILSIKNKKQLKNILKQKKINFIETKNLDLKWDEVLNEIETSVEIFEAQLLLDSGAPGYESIAYLFAPKFNSIEKLLTKITKV
ncbi:MAG: thiamine-phosphate synthase family protein [Candidatus Heimdallarchaeaceae archaeon]